MPMSNGDIFLAYCTGKVSIWKVCWSSDFFMILRSGTKRSSKQRFIVRDKY